MNIDIWSDTACPWCYIGKRRFERALAAFPQAEDVSVTWHSYQLDPSLPTHYEGSEVDYLVASKGLARDQVIQMVGHVTEQAATVGLSYDFDRLVVANSLPGHRLLHATDDPAVRDRIKEALLSAHFEQGVDIGSVEELVRIGTEAGLTEEQVRAGLVDPAVAAAVEADFARARDLGIQGVPFFVVDRRYAVSGAQPVEVFAQVLEKAWKEWRESHPPLQTVASGDACGPDGCAL